MTPDMKELRMCWQALQQLAINPFAFFDAVVPNLPEPLYPSLHVSREISKHRRRRNTPSPGWKCTTENNTSARDPDLHSPLVAARRAHHVSFDQPLY